MYRVIVGNEPQLRKKKYGLVLYESNLKVTKKNKISDVKVFESRGNLK